MRDLSILEFIKHVGSCVASIDREEGHLLGICAKMIADEAKHEIGVYQGPIGPYPAWPPLAESTEDTKENLGYPRGHPLERTGELEKSIGYSHTDHEAVIGSSDEAAVYAEMGTVKEPPRQFLSGAAYRMEKRVVELLGEGTVQVIVDGKAHVAGG